MKIRNLAHSAMTALTGWYRSPMEKWRLENGYIRSTNDVQVPFDGAYRIHFDVPNSNVTSEIWVDGKRAYHANRSAETRQPNYIDMFAPNAWADIGGTQYGINLLTIGGIEHQIVTFKRPSGKFESFSMQEPNPELLAELDRVRDYYGRMAANIIRVTTPDPAMSDDDRRAYRYGWLKQWPPEEPPRTGRRPDLKVVAFNPGIKPR